MDSSKQLSPPIQLAWAELFRLQLVPALTAYLAVALIVVGCNWLIANTGQALMVTPASASGWLLVGLNRVEVSELGDFRWTDGNSRICAEGVGRAPRSLITVQIAGAYARSLGTETVTLSPGQAAPVTVALAPELRHYRLLTGADQQRGDQVCVHIQSSAVRDPNNPRWLGVPVYGFTVTPLPLAGTVFPSVTGLSIGLGLALSWLALLHLSGVPLFVATSIVTFACALISYSLISGFVPFGAGTLRWALPTVVGLWMGVLGWLGARWWPWRDERWRAVTGVIFWSVALLIAVWLLQQISGHRGVWPLKSRLDPVPTWRIVVPIGMAILWLGVAWQWWQRPLRLAPVMVYVFGGALVLPVGFDIAVYGLHAPIALFRDSPYEYLRDTPRVAGDPIGFIANFETIAPTLSVHGSTHPPGAILFLWLIEQLFGPGPVATSWITIGLSACIPLVAVWLGWQLGNARLALASGILATLFPGHMIYSVTSLDGVFSLLLAAGAAAFFLALEPPQRPALAILAGGCIAAALFMTYAATQLFFFGITAALLALARYAPQAGWWPTLRLIFRQGLLAAGVIVIVYLLLYLTTGFNVISASRTATFINGVMMERFREYGPPVTPFLPPSYDYYLRFAAANLVSYLVFLTPLGLMVLSALYMRAQRERWQPWWAALLGALGGLVLGMWLSGLFNREVERIWMFTYPLAAVLVGYHSLQAEPAAQRWRLALYAGLMLAIFTLMKITLYTIW